MSQWSSAKAKRVLAALLRIGWAIKRKSSSHTIFRGLVGQMLFSLSTIKMKSVT